MDLQFSQTKAYDLLNILTSLNQFDQGQPPNYWSRLLKFLLFIFLLLLGPFTVQIYEYLTACILDLSCTSFYSMKILTSVFTYTFITLSMRLKFINSPSSSSSSLNGWSLNYTRLISLVKSASATHSSRYFLFLFTRAICSFSSISESSSRSNLGPFS